MKTPEEITLEGNISKLSNAENSYKLKVETLEKEVADIDKIKAEKLSEITAIEADLEVAKIGAADSKKTLMAEVDALRIEVTDLDAKKVTVKKEIDSFETKLVNVRELLTIESQALETATAKHNQFIAKATSEKERIMGELSELDETAKAQVVIIESQTALQLTLNEQNSTKQDEFDVLDRNIELALERSTTVNRELKTLEETHTKRMQETKTEFDEFMATTEAAKTKATEELAVVEADLEAKNAKAVAWVGRNEEMNQREQFLKERYAKAGIEW